MLLIMPCVSLFGGCAFNVDNDKNVYVTDIQFSRQLGNATEYIITYSNGTFSTFQVLNGTNGEDGKDGANANLKDIFNELVELNKYEDTDAGYLKFLEDYLSIESSTDIQIPVAKSLQSAVNVLVEIPVTTIENSYTVNKINLGGGAGVIYKMNEDFSYIITNMHVVYEETSDTENKIARKITIFQYGTDYSFTETTERDKDGYPIISYGAGAIDCEYVGGSLTYDLAVLRVKTDDLKAKNPTVRAVDIATNYQVAERVFAIGNPDGDGTSVTEGVVSVESEYVNVSGVDSTTRTYRTLRTDAAVNGGNSGGGLFNSSGELVGIVNSKDTRVGIDNMANALPVDNVTKVVDNLIYYYENQIGEKDSVSVKCINFGMEYDSARLNSKSIYNPATGEIKIVEDCIVKSVENRLLADAMGINVNDKIVEVVINGKTYEITRAFQFDDLALTIRAGDVISIGVHKYNDSTNEYATEITYCTDSANQGIAQTNDMQIID